MSCDPIRPLLDELLDGALEPAERVTVERHLELCDACAHELASIREIRDLARQLPSEVPGEDRWDAIVDAIATPAPRQSGSWRPWLAAAAVLFVAAGWWALSPVTPPVPTEPPPRVEAISADPALTTLERAASDLEQALEHRELDPAVLAVVRENLAVIDAAIAETRAALADQPDDPSLERTLTRITRQKVDMLRLATTGRG